MSDKRPSSPPPGSWSKRARTPGEVKQLRGRMDETPSYPADRTRRKRRADRDDAEEEGVEKRPKTRKRNVRVGRKPLRRLVLRSPGVPVGP